MKPCEYGVRVSCQQDGLLMFDHNDLIELNLFLYNKIPTSYEVGILPLSLIYN